MKLTKALMSLYNKQTKDEKCITKSLIGMLFYIVFGVTYDITQSMVIGYIMILGCVGMIFYISKALYLTVIKDFINKIKDEMKNIK